MKSNYNRVPKLNKNTHINKVRNNIIDILKDDEQLSYVLSYLFDYMMSNQMYGCCHAFASVLYVALSELGYSPSILIGECKFGNEKPFDHSWITVDNKIFDLAIYMPLNQICNSITGPIIMDVDAFSMEKCKTEYGINTGLPMGQETLSVMNTPFCVYMDHYPFTKGGLWGVLQMILPENISVDINQLREKYKNTERNLIR